MNVPFLAFVATAFRGRPQPTDLASTNGRATGAVFTWSAAARHRFNGFGPCNHIGSFSGVAQVHS